MTRNILVCLFCRRVFFCGHALAKHAHDDHADGAQTMPEPCVVCGEGVSLEQGALELSEGTGLLNNDGTSRICIEGPRGPYLDQSGVLRMNSDSIIIHALCVARWIQGLEAELSAEYKKPAEEPWDEA